MWETLGSWPWGAIVPIAISLVSLGVAVVSYRHVTAPASLVIVPQGSGPAAYSLCWYETEWGFLLLLRLPVVAVNNGGGSGVLLDARLDVPEDWSHGVPLELNEFYDKLSMQAHDAGGRFAHPIVVAPRASEMRFSQFKGEIPDEPLLAVGRHEIVMRVRTDSEPEWHEAWRFVIEIDERAHRGMCEGDNHVHWNPAERGPVLEVSRPC